MSAEKPFLENVARQIAGNSGAEPWETCLVLPNRRAGLFIRKYLAEAMTKTFFAPDIYSIGDFTEYLTGMQIAEPLSLIFDLYDIYSDEESDPQTIDDFMGWGFMMIRDFSDIDNRLLDPAEVFGYLSDSRAISLWNPGDSPLTGFERRYLRFYRSLLDYYKAFTSRIITKKQVYQGLVNRMAAEMEEDRLLSLLKWKKIWFAGFNALTRAEESLIRKLVFFGRSEVLWDADSYYLDDEMQEAGWFMRGYRKKQPFALEKWIGSHFKTGEKHLRVIGVPQKVGQAKAAAEILSRMDREALAPDKTAVILNDESLLIPLLNSIPGNISEFNVTMGYPFRHTALYSLIISLFDLHEHAVKYREVRNTKEDRFHYRDIARILSNQHIRDILGREESITHTGVGLIAAMKESGKVYFIAREIDELLHSAGLTGESLVKPLFDTWNNDPQAALGSVGNICSLLRDIYGGVNEGADPSPGNKVKLEYLYHFHLLLNRLENTPNLLRFVTSISSLRGLIEQMARSSNMPFYGEPLKGLQVMGMLESQTLDFRNVIMLSVNDDYIPAGRRDNSFIPVDIRVQFGLPTYKQANSIFAYHFYRLLQRADNVWFIYNTEPGELGGGEKSRFITQIMHELPGYNKDIRISESVLAVFPAAGPGLPGIQISKNQIVMEELNRLAGRGISASALISFINCPLQFCLKYLFRLEELPEVEETVESGTLGTVVHEVLMRLYRPFLNKHLKVDELKGMKERVAELVRDSFSENYREGGIEYGRNLLMAKVAERMISNFLIHELRKVTSGSAPVMRYLEESWHLDMPFSSEAGGLDSLRMKGIADRIDEINGGLRIIDYKTGMVRPGELKLKNWEDLNLPESNRPFQLLFYAWLFAKKMNIRSDFHAGIISLRNLREDVIPLITPEGEMMNEETLRRFEEFLSSLLSQIFDTTVAFTPTKDPSLCEFCSFSGICNR